MTCRKVRKLMPLFVGDDLGPRRMRTLRAHIDACPACRRELEGLRDALARFKAAAKDEGIPDWGEGEWQALMVRVTGGRQGLRDKKSGAGARVLWPRWAAASAVGALLGIVVLSVLFRGPVPGPEGRSRALLTADAPAAREQDIVSMTMVSRETGLQIVWFFDKDFDYKGDQE